MTGMPYISGKASQDSDWKYALAAKTSGPAQSTCGCEVLRSSLPRERCFQDEMRFWSGLNLQAPPDTLPTSRRIAVGRDIALECAVSSSRGARHGGACAFGYNQRVSF